MSYNLRKLLDDSEATSDYGSAASSRTVTPAIPTPSPSPPPAEQPAATTAVEDTKPSGTVTSNGDQVVPEVEKVIIEGWPT